jgi:hypothetical protein
VNRLPWPASWLELYDVCFWFEPLKVKAGKFVQLALPFARICVQHDAEAQAMLVYIKSHLRNKLFFLSFCAWKFCIFI